VQQLRQLGDARRDPPSLIARQQLDRALAHRNKSLSQNRIVFHTGLVLCDAPLPLSIEDLPWLPKKLHYNCKSDCIWVYLKGLDETGNEGEAKFQAERAVRQAHRSSARTDLYNKQILMDHAVPMILKSSENFSC